MYGLWGASQCCRGRDVGGEAERDGRRCGEAGEARTPVLCGHGEASEGGVVPTRGCWGSARTSSKCCSRVWETQQASQCQRPRGEPPFWPWWQLMSPVLLRFRRCCGAPPATRVVLRDHTRLSGCCNVAPLGRCGN